MSAEKLQQLFKRLPDQDRKTLLDFAEFLAARAPAPKPEITEPLDIERPAEESVIAAIKRLNKTYPMVTRSSVFHETSDLMSQHLLSGRAAMDIIDDLEALFEQRYREFLEDNE